MCKTDVHTVEVGKNDVMALAPSFWLVGGVLVERTVKEIIPTLESNKEQISKIVESLNTQIHGSSQKMVEGQGKYAASSNGGEWSASIGGASVLVS
uniref:Prefoldin subunit 2 n=1 Tax=Oncorhynchus kisutch TaxID=8019 RepID=A0A8C7IKN5_ONCKI